MKALPIHALKITLLFLVAYSFSNAQNLDTIPLNNRISILNGKAFFNFPRGAQNMQRTVDIMSADRNPNEETRVVLDIEEMRLVFFAEELFALGEERLFENVSHDYEKDSFKCKILTNEKSLLSILATPTTWDSTQNGILLNSLIVRTPDNTLFRIHALITPSAYRLKDQFIKLTEEVFKTLSKGERTTNLAARQESFQIFGTDKKFTVQIPENYVVNVDQKYDFQVFKFRKYRPYSDTNWTSITLYNGHHPSTIYRDYGFAEKDLEKIGGTFLGKKVSWLYFHIPEENYFCKEQVIPVPEIEEDLLVHLVMSSNQRASLEELSRIVEGIGLEGK